MVVCQFYLKGDCRFGNQCRNEHPARNPTRMLCQYFLRGNCRFGQNCKFEHPAKDAGGLGTNYQSPFKQSGFSSGQDRSSSFSFKSNFNRDQNPFGVLSQQTSQPKQALEHTESSSSIEQIIHKDMEIWMTSRQWPLSCYSFHKEEPCLPGLNDFSFEEVRLEAIIANANGTGMAYQQNLKDLLAKCNQRKLELKRMSSAQLHQEIKSAEIQAMSPTHSGMGTNSQSQSFGGPTQSAPLSSLGSFGVSAQPSGLFSIPSTGGQSQGVFRGNATSNQQSNNLFGSLSSTISQPANGFANSQSVNKSTGLFGSVNKNSSLTSSTFGQSSQSNSTNLFTSPPSQVGGAIQHLGTTSVRAAPLDSNGIGKPSMKTLNTPQSSTQLNSKTCLPSPSGSSNSQLISCSKEDLIAFRADSFVLGKIPECAPPPEFC